MAPGRNTRSTQQRTDIQPSSSAQPAGPTLRRTTRSRRQAPSPAQEDDPTPAPLLASPIQQGGQAALPPPQTAFVEHEHADPDLPTVLSGSPGSHPHTSHLEEPLQSASVNPEREDPNIQAGISLPAEPSTSRPGASHRGRGRVYQSIPQVFDNGSMQYNFRVGLPTTPETPILSTPGSATQRNRPSALRAQISTTEDDTAVSTPQSSPHRVRFGGARVVEDDEESWVDELDTVDQPPATPTTPDRTQSSTSRSQSTPQSRSRSRISALGSRSPYRSPRSLRRRPPPTTATTRKKAEDIWPFWQRDQTGQRYNCSFCIHQVTAKLRKKDDIRSYGAGTSTSAMRRHLGDHHLHEWIDGCKKMNLRVDRGVSGRQYLAKYEGRVAEESGERPSNIPTFSHDAFVDALIEFILADDQAFNVVENSQFRRLLMLLKQDLREADIPSRETLHKRLEDAYAEHIEDLKDAFKTALGRVSLTFDMWSDPNMRGFMAVTAHWMQNINGKLVMRSDLIGFQPVPGHHTGLHLAYALVATLERVGILSNVGWVTTDNATNNNVCMRELAEHLQVYVPNLEFDAEKNRIRCFPHIVNLACQEVISAATSSKNGAEITSQPYTAHEPVAPTFHSILGRDPIAMVRSVVRVTRASSLRREEFSQIVHRIQSQTLQLLRDVETRWSSTYLMLERAIALRPSINAFIQSHRELQVYRLTNDDWEMASCFKEILQVPAAVQQKLSGENAPMLYNTLILLKSMRDKWKEMQRSPKFLDYTSIIELGLKKLEDYYIRVLPIPAYTYAMFVHPAHKLSFYTDEQQLRSAKDMCMAALQKYSDSDATPSSPQTAAQNDNDWADQILGRGTTSRSQSYDSVCSEVTLWLSLDHTTCKDVIQFWQEHEKMWPRIYRLAMDVLPIQASAVPCERIFSSAKETLTPRRNRLSAEKMEACQMLKYSIKKGMLTLSFTRGMSLDEERKSLGSYMDNLYSVPEDVFAFKDSLGLGSSAWHDQLTP